jgi:serine/threonine protein kinase
MMFVRCQISDDLLTSISASRFLQPSALAETLCGSPLYMAPEVMQAQKYDAKVSVFSPSRTTYIIIIYCYLFLTQC